MGRCEGRERAACGEGRQLWGEYRVGLSPASLSALLLRKRSMQPFSLGNEVGIVVVVVMVMVTVALFALAVFVYIVVVVQFQKTPAANFVVSSHPLIDGHLHLLTLPSADHDGFDLSAAVVVAASFVYGAVACFEAMHLRELRTSSLFLVRLEATLSMGYLLLYHLAYQLNHQTEPLSWQPGCAKTDEVEEACFAGIGERSRYWRT